MGTSGFICFNGDYLHANEPFLRADNRAFQFGDVVTEELHAYSTEPQFLNGHLERLLSAMKLLSMEIPGHFNTNVFGMYISKLLTKNRIFGGAAIRITVFRNPSDSFVPQKNDVSFVLDCRKLDRNFYELNSRGYVIDIFQNLARYVNLFSVIKNADTFLFLTAGMYCQNNGLDDCILLNERRKIVESVHSNIFLVKDKSIFTPAINEGCVPGVLRRVIVELGSKWGIQIYDQCSLSPEAMEDADEIFLTDVINGIRWVAAYRQKRYYKKTIQFLVERLNNHAFDKWRDAV